MSYIGPLPPLKVKKETRWYRCVGDSFLVLGSILILTEIISFFHLNQRIPDSFLVYLLLILAFASIRGLFAASLASFAAFFFHDFLFVPPAYSLLVSKFEDILALMVFLVTAIMTAQLASNLRRRAEEADHRERETRILYDLVRVTNREEGLLHQLHIFTRAVVDVFSPWGIHDCSLLLPDAMGNLVPQNTMRDPGDVVMLSAAEEQMAARVMKQAQTMDFHDGLQPDKASNNAAGVVTQKAVGVTIRLVPLKTAHQVIGVLRLLIDDMRWPSSENMLSVGHDTHEALFFSTFLEQAVIVIERARLLRESVQMKVLQQTDALRTALLSSVSHDLRTPLATIKTAATSMLRMALDEDAHTFASAIERESDRLNRLVENLLDMSRIEGGALHPKKVWYPLDELVHDVLGRMEVLLQGRAVNVHFPEELLPVELDYVQIGQVLTNLLENAVRYTPDGSPIDIRIEDLAEQVLICIADRGPGISSSERERIFDKFYRVHREPAAADQFRGSGLGLAVCRGLVEAHGGHIRAQSNLPPIIVISVRDTEREKVQALDLGADDFICKPFGINEVLARIRVALRHAAYVPLGTDPCMTIGPLQMDLEKRYVSVNGREVKLTPAEYDLLKVLITNRGKIMTPQMLLTQVWGVDHDKQSHFLHVYIGQLRRKIEPDPTHPRLLLTVSGAGYRFSDE